MLGIISDPDRHRAGALFPSRLALGVIHHG
jgi:hypothetical protein